MPKSYIVKPGDTLSKIAEELLGDAARWPELLEANKDDIDDPDMLKVGMQLIVLADEDDSRQSLPDHEFK